MKTRLKNKQLSGVVLFLSLFFLNTLAVWADDVPLILQYIEAAQPSQEEIAKVKKHLQEKKEIKLLAELSLVPFHKRSEKQIIATDKVYCNGCHLPIPHSKSLRTRTFMNMHSTFIACESCHFKPEQVGLQYRWYDYAKRSEAELLPGRLHSGRQQGDETPLIARDGEVKIAPFEQNYPVLITRDHEFSKNLQQRWKNADISQRAKIQAKIHKPLTTKGTECADCHVKENGLIDLIALSDTPEQAKAIQRNTIADFFKHYKPEKPLPPGALPEPEQRIKITDLLN